MTRYAPLLVVTALSIATAGVVAGCASSRSVLYSGVSAGASHPAQAAPLVIVQTRDYLALARAVPAIDSSLDPHTGHNDRTGWAYEAFFLEAQDERGIPFIAVSNFMRGAEPGGGQWARSNQLYPFAHG